MSAPSAAELRDGQEKAEAGKLTEGSKQREQSQPSLQPNPAGGLPNWGDFKLNFHYLLLPLNLCSSIAKKDPHISPVDMHMHLVPHPQPAGTHYLSRRVAPRVARSVSCHFVMLGSCKRVARRLGGRRQKVKATAGTRGLITTFGASRPSLRGLITQSHANCTGNTGKQHDAEAGVNRFTKTMKQLKRQTT